MRQFDESLQRLGKLLFAFFSEENVESFNERQALMKMAFEQMGEEYLLAKSIQAGHDAIVRMNDKKKDN